MNHSTLFGTTAGGGENGEGTVFSMNADGRGFTLLHEFVGGENDGREPRAGLIFTDSRLFGTTASGGDNEAGTLFSINSDGSDFMLLHEFAGGGSDGERPAADLALSGSALFGTTLQGGDDNLGTIFSISTDGSGFRLLHEFAGGNDDGRDPRGRLTLSGSTLFGTTYGGGGFDQGAVFRINTDGSGFMLLHEFEGGDNDGRLPNGGLVVRGSTLFGSTNSGGDFDRGTVYQINIDGGGFMLLHEFEGGDDGLHLVGDLIISGSRLFGTTRDIDDQTGGTVFSILIPEPSGLALILTALCTLAFSASKAN